MFEGQAGSEIVVIFNLKNHKFSLEMFVLYIFIYSLYFVYGKSSGCTEREKML